MKLLNLGCGGNILNGWENHDDDVDISKPLPWPDTTWDAILAEHVVEHITAPQGFGFFKEARRILTPGGVLRIAVPDIVRVYSVLVDVGAEAYRQWTKEQGFSDGTIEGCLAGLIENHGHQAIWTEDTLMVALLCAGFDRIAYCVPGKSDHPHLRNVEGHGKVIGDEFNGLETTVVEATKPECSSATPRL